MEKKILDYLLGLDDFSLMDIYNEYADANNYEIVYDMGALNDLFRGDDPLKIARCIYGSNFSPFDTFFTFDGDWHLKSFSDIKSALDFPEVAAYIVRTCDPCGRDEIAELLEEGSGGLSVDMWGNHTENEIASYNCTFYPDGVYYAGNLYDADGDVIGDFVGVDSVEIETRFPGIFKG